MNARLTSIEHCEVAGLAAHEILLGATPGETHERLLAAYCRERRSLAVARSRIVSDIRAAVARGATGDAADLLIVLRRLLSLAAPDVRPACARRSLGRRRRGRAVANVQQSVFLLSTGRGRQTRPEAN
jgi:hypothetical protein